MKTHVTLMTTVAVVALGITACGSAPDPVSATDLSVSQISEAGDQQEIDELINAWEDTSGITCQASLTDASEYGAQRVHCGDSAVLSIYDSASAIKQNLELVDKVNREVDLESEWLTGPNWTVNDEPERMQELQSEIGGLIITLGH